MIQYKQPMAEEGSDLQHGLYSTDSIKHRLHFLAAFTSKECIERCAEARPMLTMRASTRVVPVRLNMPVSQFLNIAVEVLRRKEAMLNYLLLPASTQHASVIIIACRVCL